MGCPVCFACGVSGFFGGVVFVELFHSFFLCFFQVTFRLFRSSFHEKPFLVFVLLHSRDSSGFREGVVS